MDEVTRGFGAAFIKISQSVLINKAYLRYVHKKRKEVELIDRTFLPYSIQLKELLELLLPENR